MNTKTIAIVVAAVVVLGGGYYFYAHRSASPSMYGDADATQDKGANGTFSGSLQDLMARGGNYKCTFDSSTADAQSSGTVYQAPGKTRGDFVSKAQGVTVMSHMISMDGYVYTWTDISPVGYKTKVTPTSASAPAYGSESAQGGANQAYNYDCVAWSPDASVFTLPNITFTDLSGN